MCFILSQLLSQMQLLEISIHEAEVEVEQIGPNIKMKLFAVPQVAQYAQRISQEFLNFEIMSDHRIVTLETFFTKIITESNMVNYLFKTIIENAGVAEEADFDSPRTFNGAPYTEFEMLKLCHQKCLKVALNNRNKLSKTTQKLDKNCFSKRNLQKKVDNQ